MTDDDETTQPESFEREDARDRDTLPPAAGTDTERAPPPDWPEGAPDWSLCMMREVRSYRDEARLERAAVIELTRALRKREEAVSLAEEVSRLNQLLTKKAETDAANWQIMRESFDGIRGQMAGNKQEVDRRLEEIERRLEAVEIKVIPSKVIKR